MGRDASINEIAAEIGVSKTAFSRYFVDKNDLTTAVAMRFTNDPDPQPGGRTGPAWTVRADPRDHPGAVDTVAAEPEPYRFVMANSSASRNKVVADPNGSSRMPPSVAPADAAGRHGHRRGVEPGPHDRRRSFSFTHSWMSNLRMTSAELIDYLTMLCWNALCGIVEAGGSLKCSTPSRTRRPFAGIIPAAPESWSLRSGALCPRMASAGALTRVN